MTRKQKLPMALTLQQFSYQLYRMKTNFLSRDFTCQTYNLLMRKNLSLTSTGKNYLILSFRCSSLLDNYSFFSHLEKEKVPPHTSIPFNKKHMRQLISTGQPTQEWDLTFQKKYKSNKQYIIYGRAIYPSEINFLTPVKTSSLSGEELYFSVNFWCILFNSYLYVQHKICKCFFGRRLHYKFFIFHWHESLFTKFPIFSEI